MNNAPLFFSLHSKTMHPCFLTRDARDEAQANWLCNSCVTPKSNVTAVDVRLQERKPRDKPLNFVYSCGVPLVHWELLALIGNEIVQRDLYIGRVFDDRGREIKDWMTARGRRRLIERGNGESHCRRCSECNRILYCATGDPYLYPAPASDTDVFGNDYLGLTVSLEIYERIMAHDGPRPRIKKLPVLDAPLDGLGILSAG